MTDIYADIKREAQRQRQKWGAPRHDPYTWVVILTEELGEVAKAALEVDKDALRVELTQLAAVCASALESLEYFESAAE